MQSLYFRVGLNIDFLGGVTDAQNGKVWLMLQEKKAGVTVFTSDDEGVTWSKPKNLFKDWNIESWSPDIKVSSLKPGCAHGIQLENELCGGTKCDQAGRLLIPFVCTNASASGTHGDKGCTTCLSCNIYSDDAGTSWKLGGVGQPGTRESSITQVWSKTSGTELYVNERNMGAHPGQSGPTIVTDPDSYDY
jgi:hypothetical protein